MRQYSFDNSDTLYTNCKRAACCCKIKFWKKLFCKRKIIYIFILMLCCIQYYIIEPHFKTETRVDCKCNARWITLYQMMPGKTHLISYLTPDRKQNNNNILYKLTILRIFYTIGHFGNLK